MTVKRSKLKTANWASCIRKMYFLLTGIGHVIRSLIMYTQSHLAQAARAPVEISV